ncbi:hypothetical protein LCGC14_1113600, partial [marine sediment metagenome]
MAIYKNYLKDKNGNSILGAQACLYNDEGQRLNVDITERDGLYYFRDIETGHYQVRFFGKDLNEGDWIEIDIVEDITGEPGLPGADHVLRNGDFENDDVGILDLTNTPSYWSGSATSDTAFESGTWIYKGEYPLVGAYCISLDDSIGDTVNSEVFTRQSDGKIFVNSSEKYFLSFWARAKIGLAGNITATIIEYDYDDSLTAVNTIILLAEVTADATYRKFEASFGDDTSYTFHADTKYVQVRISTSSTNTIYIDDIKVQRRLENVDITFGLGKSIYMRADDGAIDIGAGITMSGEFSVIYVGDSIVIDGEGDSGRGSITIGSGISMFGSGNIFVGDISIDGGTADGIITLGTSGKLRTSSSGNRIELYQNDMDIFNSTTHAKIKFEGTPYFGLRFYHDYDLDIVSLPQFLIYSNAGLVAYAEEVSNNTMVARYGRWAAVNGYGTILEARHEDTVPFGNNPVTEFIITNTAQTTGWQIGWCDTGGTVDTNLYRSAANNLTTDDRFNVCYGITNPTTNTYGITFGGLTADSPDTNLYRGGNNLLKTDDAFEIAQPGTTWSNGLKLSSGGNDWEILQGGGEQLIFGYDLSQEISFLSTGNEIRFGSENADTNLYRSSSD